jgi:L-threonylcarbamoyladenylate synthase
MPALVDAGEVLAGGAPLDRIVEEIRGGGLVAYPTETFYALGVDATSGAAVERLFRVKGRERGIPVPLIIATPEALARVARRVPPAARKLMDRFWPGPLTLVLEAAPDLPEGITGGTGAVGVRISDHPAAAAIARACPFPLTATSANRSGEASAASPAALSRTIHDALDVLVDGGRTKGAPASTVLDVTVVPPRLVRPGRIDRAAIEAVLGGAPIAEKG